MVSNEKLIFVRLCHLPVNLISWHLLTFKKYATWCPTLKLSDDNIKLSKYTLPPQIKKLSTICEKTTTKKTSSSFSHYYIYSRNTFISPWDACILYFSKASIQDKYIGYLESIINLLTLLLSMIFVFSVISPIEYTPYYSILNLQYLIICHPFSAKFWLRQALSANINDVFPLHRSDSATWL